VRVCERPQASDVDAQKMMKVRVEKRNEVTDMIFPLNERHDSCKSC